MKQGHMNRQEYMKASSLAFRTKGDKAATEVHNQYYRQFVTPEMLRYLRLLLGKKIRASTDEHFNDIPLKLWDNMPRYEGVYKALLEANGGGGTSLSDWVCVYKQAAAMIREEKAA